MSYDGAYKELIDFWMLNISKAPTRDMFIFYIRRLIILSDTWLSACLCKLLEVFLGLPAETRYLSLSARRNSLLEFTNAIPRHNNHEIRL